MGMFQRRSRTRSNGSRGAIRNDAMRQESSIVGDTCAIPVTFDDKSMIKTSSKIRRKKKNGHASLNDSIEIQGLILIGFGVASLIILVYVRVGKKSVSNNNSTLQIKRDNSKHYFFRPVYPPLPDGRRDPNRRNEDLSFDNNFDPLVRTHVLQVRSFTFSIPTQKSDDFHF